jgi:hypothetical protein
MTRKLIQMLLLIGVMVPTLAAGTMASAQVMIPPGSSPLSPPPPAPPPPPPIEVPVVPKMDEMPRQSPVQSSRRGSFSDRITTCLQDGAAAGLDSADRATYSRSCANQ